MCSYNVWAHRKLAQPRAHLIGNWMKCSILWGFQYYTGHLTHSCYFVPKNLYVLSIRSHPCAHNDFGERGSRCTKCR